MTTSPHTKPAVASAAGTIIGVLTIIQGFFGSGHLPSGAEVAAILGGSGLTLGSLGAFVAHHAAWVKTVGPVAAAELPAVEAAVKAVPGLSERLGEVEHAVQQQVDRVAPAVDLGAVADKVKAMIVHDAVTSSTVTSSTVTATPPADPPAATPVPSQ